MRTLVISDLHLGAAHGRPRLEDEVVLARLLRELANCDRLVLLGDVVELRELRVRDALAAASRVLPQLAAALPDGAQVVIVPGNHDHELLGPWIARRRRDDDAEHLEPETAVDWESGEPLDALARCFTTASVRVAYPGIWLRPDVYAHHGHFLDRLTKTPSVERLAAGGMSRMLKLPQEDLRSVDDFERALAPIYAWMFAISEQGGPEVDEPDTRGSTKILKLVNESRGAYAQGLKVGIAGAVNLLEMAGLGDLSPNLAGEALRRNSLLAFGQVLKSLELTPAYAIFGHTHRAGPLPEDDPAEWRTASGVRLFNSGSWIKETAFLGSDPSQSPYRAGFAVELGNDGPPRLINLLD